MLAAEAAAVRLQSEAGTRAAHEGVNKDLGMTVKTRKSNDFDAKDIAQPKKSKVRSRQKMEDFETHDNVQHASKVPASAAAVRGPQRRAVI